MSDANEFYTVGWVQDAQGLRGECFLRLYTKDPDWLGLVNVFNLVEVTRECKEKLKKKSTSKEISEREILQVKKLSITKLKPHKNGYIVKFKKISDRTQAESLKGYMVQIENSILAESSDEEDFYFEQVLGFMVVDQGETQCGTVKSHYHNGAHDILILENNFSGKEVPFVDHFIEKIDFENKKILMNLPEGLFDL